MTNTVQGDYLTTNPDGSLEVGFIIDGTIHTSRVMTPAQLLEAANFLTAHAIYESLCLASWLGVNPTADNHTKFTDFIVEIDFSDLVVVRRVLDLEIIP